MLGLHTLVLITISCSRYTDWYTLTYLVPLLECLALSPFTCPLVKPYLSCPPFHKGLMNNTGDAHGRRIQTQPEGCGYSPSPALSCTLLSKFPLNWHFFLYGTIFCLLKCYLHTSPHSYNTSSGLKVPVFCLGNFYFLRAKIRPHFLRKIFSDFSRTVKNFFSLCCHRTHNSSDSCSYVPGTLFSSLT